MIYAPLSRVILSKSRCVVAVAQTTEGDNKAPFSFVRCKFLCARYS